MLTVWLKAICLTSILGVVLKGVCIAGNTNTACQTSLAEDKPPCIEMTRYVPEAGGSNVLKTTLVFVGNIRTNANNEIIREVNLPPKLANQLPPTAPFMAPSGATMILNPGTDIEGLGPAILNSIQRSHLPNATNRAWPPQQTPKIYTKGLAQGIVPQPFIAIKGMSDEPMLGVSYDIQNDKQTLTNLHGFVTDEFYDDQQRRFTTNWFECLDIHLAPGTNVILVHCHYLHGHRLTIKKTYVLRLDLKTNAPIFQVVWPVPGRPVSGEEVTLRGNTDDDNVTVTGEITDGNQNKMIEGLVERNGRFWLEHIPLLAKTNHIKITMTDVVGNSSITNLTIIKDEDKIVINPVPPEQLWQMQVTVTGNINPPNRTVWVNGLKANVQTNGEWMASGVPMTKDGVAVFDVLAMQLSEQPLELAAQNVETNSEIKPAESVSIRTAYSPTEIILNASQPTYGTFKIHLTGTGGQSFVLQDSTNLVNWAPILTNINSAAIFDYYDTNVVMYGCRFFRVVPVR